MQMTFLCRTFIGIGLKKKSQYQSRKHFSIKHGLARSCFQLWPKIGDEGDQISRKRTGEAPAETVFSRNFGGLGNFGKKF